jgi:hypothetical protein
MDGGGGVNLKEDSFECGTTRFFFSSSSSSSLLE